MKRLSILLLLCTIFSVVCAQKPTHRTASAARINRRSALPLGLSKNFQDVSLSDALKYIQSQATDYDVVFIYDELEDFRVTTNVQQKSVPEAIMQVVGFYPVRIVRSGEREIYVECSHKAERHLTGSIIDEGGQPVAYANITLLNPADSTVLCGGVSNEAGVFVIPFSQSSVIARISCIGYKTIYHQYNKEKVGIIRMQPETQRLRGITVEGQVPVLRREAGTVIFDTRHIAGAANATDLLRYTPGVMIEEDNVSLFGASGIVFQINGREQRIGSKEMVQMLKSYSASDVEKIEIVQNPGASYSAEGNAGVINIVLKKKDNDYIGGSAAYARTQYEEHGDEANASIIYNKGKVSTSLNLAGTWDHTRYIETNDISFPDNLRHNADNGRIKKENYSLRWQGDYRVSDKLNLGAYVMYADGERHLSIDGLYDFLPKNLYSLSSINTQTQRQEDTKTWAVNINVTQFIGNTGAKLDCNLDYYRMSMGDTRHSISNMSIIENSLDNIHQSDTTDFDYQNQITQTVDNYSAKVDVSYVGLRVGTQYAYTRSHRDLDYSGVGSYNHVSSTYDEQIWAGYVEYGRKFGNAWSINLGGRYEHTWTKVNNRPVEYGKRSDYGKLFPSLNIGYHPNKSHTFNWSLSNRITRPNIINLNPNRVWRDVNHVSSGNQNLKPSYLHKAMIGYTYKGVLSFDFYYTYEHDRIDAVYLVNEQVTHNSWDNITDEHNIGINSFYCFDKYHWMTATLMQGVWYSKTVRPERENILGQVRKNKYPQVECLSYTGMLQASFYFDHNRKWTGILNATYSSPEKDITKTLNARYMVDIGLQYRFWKDRLTLGLICRNLLASRIKGTEHIGNKEMDFDNKFNYRQLRFSLTYNWGAHLRHNRRHYESDDMQKRIVNDF